MKLPRRRIETIRLLAEWLALSPVFFCPDVEGARKVAECVFNIVRPGWSDRLVCLLASGLGLILIRWLLPDCLTVLTAL